ncbi:hypothetical protein [Sphingomonas nostoxanthinifaciens]|uniref:hypothetical protein n=1 Tax=Sphingomonas nostoxanthinifaciens TaxID=2872652 RepID=UPI001CC1F35D|nr:hypothetical protein [Sphingomonas nostoxanthinifaciens]UAK24212.1 hypothetical protein K8P63_18075 [Sphingomonas nostoxanthinifaciens]
MTSSAGTPRQIAAEASLPLSAHGCPECGERFPRVHPFQIFCNRGHGRAWEARNRHRGAQLYPFAVVARMTRGGTRGDRVTGARAHQDADQLINRWRDEDADAGRMGLPEYLSIRYQLGFGRP